MGLFGFVKKAIGKVAKSGLSVVTKGASDKIFSALKGKGNAKAAAKQAYGGITTNQTQAQIAKVAKPAKSTTAVIKQATGVKRKAKKRKKAAADPYRSAQREPTRAKAPRVKTAKVKKVSNRKPPKGGLNLKAMSAKWRAAGSPGTWQQWIKSNPIKTA